MVLLKDIAFWAVVVVLQLASDYQVAKISLRVKGGWKNYHQEKIEDSSLFKILFFPSSAADKLNEYQTIAYHFFFNHLSGRFYILYIFIHMLFWEIRIVLNIIYIILAFVIAPLVALFATIVSRMSKSAWAVFKTALSA